jgi:hypothetical protein
MNVPVAFVWCMCLVCMSSCCILCMYALMLYICVVCMHLGCPVMLYVLTGLYELMNIFGQMNLWKVDVI